MVVRVERERPRASWPASVARLTSFSPGSAHGLHGHQRRLADRPLEDERARVVGDPAHHVKPSRSPGHHDRGARLEQEAAIGKDRRFRPLDPREECLHIGVCRS